jgi:threonine dehydrogenase-like Zn-dependent dehydrogenase
MSARWSCRRACPRIIAIETVPERIALANGAGATDIIDFEKEDVFERIREISKGGGADAVIDCVGVQASAGHGHGRVMSALKETVLPAERTFVLDQAIRPSVRAASCRFRASTAVPSRSTWVRSCRRVPRCAADRPACSVTRRLPNRSVCQGEASAAPTWS